jgi:hypothetical protein
LNFGFRGVWGIFTEEGISLARLCLFGMSMLQVTGVLRFTD